METSAMAPCGHRAIPLFYVLAHAAVSTFLAPKGTPASTRRDALWLSSLLAILGIFQQIWVFVDAFFIRIKNPATLAHACLSAPFNNTALLGGPTEYIFPKLRYLTHSSFFL